MTRQVCFVLHATREEVPPMSRTMAKRLRAEGIDVAVAGDCLPEDLPLFSELDPERLELAVVLGGDGTILRAAEAMHPHGVPILGVNLGRVGFLAELEPDGIDELIRAIVDRTWTVEERRALAVRVENRDGSIWTSWALNEVAIEKSARDRMLELVVSVDGRPVMAWGGDGLICATPTGSTAYAFSAGGPIVWPDVDAHLIVPISAHALFARPLVTAPTAQIDVEIADTIAPAVVACDGRRHTLAGAGAKVQVLGSDDRVRFARVHTRSFADRLVAKFELPVTGWRNRDQA